MSRWLTVCVVLLLQLASAPALAQTRAWLDRDEIRYGETATLNIETDQGVAQLDYRALEAQFDLAGQTVRRSYRRASSGASTQVSLFAVGIRPRGPGVLTVPSLRVGNVDTPVQRLTVLPPSVRPASGDADVFVETIVDAAQPYVQQAVGVLVRLHYAVPLMSGQLDQEAPAGASLQRIGEDLTYQRDIDGRRFNVVERRYLLVPERSGPLAVPGARFNGVVAGGFFDRIFDDGRKPLSAAAAPRRLQVRPIPATAPQPWLPLRDLRLRWLQAPRDARVGEATIVEIELQADGASASQLPAIVLPQSDAVQMFPEPAQTDERFVEARPRTVQRRRIALVPTRAGTLEVPGPRIEWWDAVQGVARTAMLPPLTLEVAPGVAQPADDQAVLEDGLVPGKQAPGSLRRLAQSWWLLALAIALVGAWRWRRRRTAMPQVPALADARPAAPPPPPSLKQALAKGDLPGIAHGLASAAGVTADDLDGVHARLDDAAQRDAVRALQAARWGGSDPAAALAALRAAFKRGPFLRADAGAARPLLPPLYPE